MTMEMMMDDALMSARYVNYEDFPPGFDIDLYVRQNPGMVVLRNGTPYINAELALPYHQHQQDQEAMHQHSHHLEQQRQQQQQQSGSKDLGGSLGMSQHQPIQQQQQQQQQQQRRPLKAATSEGMDLAVVHQRLRDICATILRKNQTLFRILLAAQVMNCTDDLEISKIQRRLSMQIDFVTWVELFIESNEHGYLLPVPDLSEVVVPECLSTFDFAKLEELYTQMLATPSAPQQPSHPPPQIQENAPTEPSFTVADIIRHATRK